MLFRKRPRRIADCLFATNRYGAYCIPVAAFHRPAAECVLAGKVWEERAIEFMLANCGQGAVITAGAFFGDALPALSKATTGTIWAFEPSPENYRCAAMTVLLNDLKNVRLQNVGLGETAEKRQLVVKDHDGRALGGASQIADITDRGTQSVPVNLVAIDEVIPPASTVSIIHLDIEGFEEYALRGAMQTIRRNRPLLLLETLPKPDLLSLLGYRVTRELDVQVLLLEPIDS
jgi:FkbM family methyltransferase